MTTPTAFITYSWDDEDHKAWVKGLAERLRAGGVNVLLDIWGGGSRWAVAGVNESQSRPCNNAPTAFGLCFRALLDRNQIRFPFCDVLLRMLVGKPTGAPTKCTDH